MDPITHAVVGMAVTKAVGQGLALNDPVSTAVILGSVVPDLDIVLQKWGDYVYLKNHRGFSHSLPGLTASSAMIALAVSLLYTGSGFFSTFLWAFIGCFSHVALDMLNSYGVKLLWPLLDKKLSYGLLIIFDPILFGAAAGFAFVNGRLRYIFPAVLAFYMLLRVLMKLYTQREIRELFGKEDYVYTILPSMTGLFRWHFILEGREYNVIGEKDILKRGVKIIRTLHKLSDLDRKVWDSAVARFFSEFTPLFHIVREKAGGITRYIFIDMRYYLHSGFLHHAVLEIDGRNSVVRQTFNPYRMSRSSSIPM